MQNLWLDVIIARWATTKTHQLLLRPASGSIIITHSAGRLLLLDVHSVLRHLISSVDPAFRILAMLTIKLIPT
jgi:hypothetical protein